VGHPGKGREVGSGHERTRGMKCNTTSLLYTMEEDVFEERILLA
jgi:hypothetical protein